MSVWELAIRCLDIVRGGIAGWVYCTNFAAGCPRSVGQAGHCFLAACWVVVPVFARFATRIEKDAVNPDGSLEAIASGVVAADPGGQHRLIAVVGRCDPS